MVKIQQKNGDKMRSAQTPFGARAYYEKIYCVLLFGMILV